MSICLVGLVAFSQSLWILLVSFFFLSHYLCLSLNGHLSWPTSTEWSEKNKKPWCTSVWIQPSMWQLKKNLRIIWSYHILWMSSTARVWLHRSRQCVVCVIACTVGWYSAVTSQREIQQQDYENDSLLLRLPDDLWYCIASWLVIAWERQKYSIFWPWQ